MHLNYGAVLHSFAFQQYINEIGIENEVIDYYPNFMENWNMKFPIWSSIKNHALRSTLQFGISFFENIDKYNKFQKFYKANMKFTEKKYNSYNIQYSDEWDYDVLICESDVIWSPHTTGHFEKAFFGNVPCVNEGNTVCISYAASIGNFDFNIQQKNEFTELLKSVSRISVREYQAVDFITDLTNRKPAKVLDPTFLIKPKIYKDIAIKPKLNNYLLIYNCLKNDKKMLKEAHLYAKKNKLKIVEISMYPLNRVKHKVMINAGIEEFLGMFMNAHTVFTNAFHGTCFSIIFKKNFYTYARGNKDSRMLSLLTDLNLLNHFIRHDEKNEFLNDIIWDNVDVLLDELKNISKNYILSCLNNPHI